MPNSDISRRFDVVLGDNSVRLLNWSDYLDTSSEMRPKLNQNAVVFVTYNLADEAVEAINLLLAETVDLDIIVIDNHSDNHNFNKLCECSKDQRNVSLLRTTENIGGAGGYAVGLEFALDRLYERIIVTEDDAKLVTLGKLHEISDVHDENIHVIRFKNNNCNSFSFHFTSYPLDLLLKVGVPDPDYFMRCDDLEFAHRVNYWCKKLQKSTIVHSDIEYVHPVIKPTKSIWAEYFSLRNAYYTYAKHKLLSLYMMESLKRFPYALARYIYTGDDSSIRIFFIAFLDFVCNRRGNEINQRRLSHVRNFKPIFPVFQKEFVIELSRLPGLYKYKSVGSVLQNLISYIKPSSGLLECIFLSNDEYILATSFFSPTLPITLCSKNVLFIEELDSNNETGKVAVYVNRSRFRRTKFVIVCFVSLAIVTILNLVLFIKYLSPSSNFRR